MRDCELELPAGCVAALVGPNGAGKSTLLRLAVGLLAPTEGTITVLGARPSRRGAPHGLGFLAQDKPLYAGLSVEEMLRAAAALNTGGPWDAARARRLTEQAGLAMRSRVGTLSGGQRSRLALALALGRTPRLLLLDEPLRDLDPLARRQVITAVLAEVADYGTSVLLSSHVLAELEDVCDHLVLLRDGAVPLSGSIASLLAGHRVVVGDVPVNPESVVHRGTGARRATALVRGPAPEPGPTCVVEEPTLDELVLGYLQEPDRGRGRS